MVFGGNFVCVDWGSEPAGLKEVLRDHYTGRTWIVTKLSWADMKREVYFGKPRIESDVIHVPQWALFLLFAIPTAYLWWTGRPSSEGLCRSCRYNLTGNTSGICPECGTPIPEEANKKLSTDPPKQ